MDTKRYTKLFNYGYFLSKNDPQLYKTFVKASKDSHAISEPLKAGGKQYQKEMVLKKAKSISRPKDISKKPNKGIDPPKR